MNSLALGKFGSTSKNEISKHILQIDVLGASCEIGLRTQTNWWEVHISSGDGLVLSGTKPLPKSVLTQICVTI